MRAPVLAGLLGLLLPILSGHAIARAPLDIETDEPENFGEIEEQVSIAIPDYLNNVQCGGWNLNESVEGRVSTITGLPGREHEWGENIPSGMGVRKDADEDSNSEFIFPETTKGLSTTCEEGKSQTIKLIWDESQHKKVPTPIGYPYFKDAPCRWRLKGGARPQPNPRPYTANDFEEVDGMLHSPVSCTNFCTYLNDWVYTDCGTTASVFDDDNNFLHETCIETVTRYICTDNVKKDVNEGRCVIGEQDGHTPACSDNRDNDKDGRVDMQDPDCNNPQDNSEGNIPECRDGIDNDDNGLIDFPQDPGCSNADDNSERDNEQRRNGDGCEGESCRCPGPGCTESMQAQWNVQFGQPSRDVNLPESSPEDYLSFYRQYQGTYSRQKIPDVPDDVSSATAPVGCFGFYDEFDPKDKQTVEKDRRCVINIDVSRRIETQADKGQTKQNLQDPTPESRHRNTEYDEETDIWYSNLGGGFSLLNEKVFEENYDKDLANAFLALDPTDKAAMEATIQTDDQEESRADYWAESNRKRAFDDTGEHRTVVSWWQKQQNEMAELLHRPVVRLLLPSAWGLGINVGSVQEAGASVKSNPRTETVEVQVDASEDVLGEILSIVEQSLLVTLEEEPVPLIVPLGSATEFRVQAEAWCTWVKLKENARNCDDAPDNVQELMDRLHEYADQIENVRILRGEIAYYAGSLLKLQRDLTRPIRDWAKKVIDEYQRIIDGQQQASAIANDQWREVQEVMAEFQAETNQPWCMQQQFTAPIYSLLDTWLNARTDEGATTNLANAELRLPNLTASSVEDLLIDLSTITYIQEPLSIPVLRPIQLRLDIPQPPSISEEATFDPLPPLQDMEAVRSALRKTIDKLPKLNVSEAGSVPPITLPEPLTADEIDSIAQTVGKIKEVVDAMNETYSMFWESIGPLSLDDDGGDVQRNKENLACTEWDDETCQHVEMDLVERFMRIGSRPGVNLIEDYNTLGAPRTLAGTCAPGDDVCTPIHAERSIPKQQWDIIGPTEDVTYINEVREDVRRLTIPQPIGAQSVETYGPYTIDIQEVLPVLDVPGKTELSTTPSDS